MTKSYQVKTFLVDCKGYSWEEIDNYTLEELLNLVGKDIGECTKFLEVPKSYLQ